MSSIKRICRFTEYTPEEADAEFHLTIARSKALKRRDSSGARAAMRKHFTRLIDALLKESEEQAYKEVQRKASESRSRYTLSQQIL